MGESSLPEALPYDQVNSIPYQTYYNISDLLPKLSEKYNARMKLNSDYEYVLERKKRVEEMSSKKEISLSEAVRKKESEAADKWRLNLENKLRLSKGEKPLESLTELNEDETAGPHASEIDVKNPFILQAAELTIDFIELVTGGVVKN
jgi:carboxyl-terminal processing protease